MNIFRADINYQYLEELKNVFSEYYQHLYSYNIAMKLVPKGEEMWLDSLKKSLNKTSVLIVAEQNNTIQGFAQGQLKLNPDYLGNLRTGVVAHFYVRENARRTNIGKQMFEEMKKWFNEKEVHSIELQSIQKNEVGLKFWQKMGFETELQQMRLKK